MESLILAQDERWRRASYMQVERERWRRASYMQVERESGACTRGQWRTGE